MPMIVSTALALAVAIAVHLHAWLEPSCANEFRRIVMKSAGGVGCFEFWLFRYQSAWAGLIGAAAALTAAVVAWRAVQRQVEKQEEANQINNLTFWEKQIESHEWALVALKECKVVIDIVADADAVHDESFTEAARSALLRSAGSIGAANYTSDQMVLRLSARLDRMRKALDIDGKDERETLLADVFAQIKELGRELPVLISTRERGLREAIAVVNVIKPQL